MKRIVYVLVIGIVLFECRLVLAIGTATEGKIEPQKVSIIGKDRSAMEEEEEEVIMTPLPPVKPPAYTMEKIEPPKVEPKPILPKMEVLKKPSAKEKKPFKPILYSFGMAYGGDETLFYDFTHSNETKEVGYYFRIDRSRSAGFTYKNISPFKKFSQDCIAADTITNFKKWLLHTKVEYLNKDLTLPYQQNFVENKLNKALSLSYEVKVQPESKLSLGLDIGNTDISISSGTAKNDAIGVHLGYNTSFKKGSPPLSIGTKLYQEKSKFTAQDWKWKSYSLYMEGKRFKIHPLLLLDVKMSLDEYKNSFSASQLDFLLKLYYNKKENINISGSIERELSLPDFDDLYINNDYSWIKPNLKPEKSWKYKVDGDYRVSDELFVEGTAFIQRTKDYIIWTGGSATTYIYTPDNISKASFSGLESGLRYYFNPKLSQNISYRYTNARNKSDGVIPYIPKSKLIMGLRYKEGDKLTFNLNTEYAGNRYAGTSTSVSDLESYFIVNITGEKRVNENLFYSFSLENLLGEEYQYLAGYPGQKRRFTVGVRLRF